MPMKYAICNETFKDWAWDKTCKAAATLGYTGLEVAPFTLAESAADVPADKRAECKKIAEDCGLTIIGLHWLFVSPPGLYLNHPDDAIRAKTVDYLHALVDLCGDLGGELMVLGSPKQRDHIPECSFRDTFLRAADTLSKVMDHCAERGVTICFEPLTPAETNFINRADEGVALIKEVNHPNLSLHLDTKAMYGGEIMDIPDVIRAYKDWVHHIHCNDPNLLGPGMGDLQYESIAEAIKEIGYNRWLSVEVFNYKPGAENIGRQSLEYLKKMFGEA